MMEEILKEAKECLKKLETKAEVTDSDRLKTQLRNAAYSFLQELESFQNIEETEHDSSKFDIEKLKNWLTWSKEELGEYLRESGVSDKTVEIFESDEIEGQHIPNLTMDLLMMRGVSHKECIQIRKIFEGLMSLEKKTQSMKVYNDPIHGHIEVNPACQAIIDTPIFQRLRFLKQLGMVYYVYPGAGHNRFEHSLGVYHLAGQFVRNLQLNQPELNITEKDILCVEIAALCHDLGHGPFSHVFDNLFLPAILDKNIKKEKKPIQKVLRDDIMTFNTAEDNKEGIIEIIVNGINTLDFKGDDKKMEAISKEIAELKVLRKKLKTILASKLKISTANLGKAVHTFYDKVKNRMKDDLRQEISWGSISEDSQVMVELGETVKTFYKEEEKRIKDELKNEIKKFDITQEYTIPLVARVDEIEMNFIGDDKELEAVLKKIEDLKNLKTEAKEKLKKSLSLKLTISTANLGKLVYIFYEEEEKFVKDGLRKQIWKFNITEKSKIRIFEIFNGTETMCLIVDNENAQSLFKKIDDLKLITKEENQHLKRYLYNALKVSTANLEQKVHTYIVKEKELIAKYVKNAVAQFAFSVDKNNSITEKVIGEIKTLELKCKDKTVEPLLKKIDELQILSEKEKKQLLDNLNDQIKILTAKLGQVDFTFPAKEKKTIIKVLETEISKLNTSETNKKIIIEKVSEVIKAMDFKGDTQKVEALLTEVDSMKATSEVEMSRLEKLLKLQIANLTQKQEKVALALPAQHDKIAVLLIDVLDKKVKFKENYQLDDRDVRFIKEMIGGPLKITGTQRWPYKGRGEDKSFLYEIVCNKRNSNDVNVWDYLARDCHHLGFNNNFDHSRFMKFARVIDDDGEMQICIRDKEIANLYNMFYTRYTLHKYAYQHKVNFGLEMMVKDVLKYANDVVLLEGENGSMVKISDCMKEEGLKAFISLNDNILFKILNFSETELQDKDKKKLRKAKEIIERIFKRKLYTCHWESQPLSPKSFEYKNEPVYSLDKKLKTLVTYGYIKEKGYIIKLTHFDFGMKEENPVERLKVYSKKSPDKARYFTKAESSIILGPAKFNETILRVYLKESVVDDAKALVETCDNWYKEWVATKQKKQEDEDITNLQDTIKGVINEKPDIFMPLATEIEKLRLKNVTDAVILKKSITDQVTSGGITRDLATGILKKLNH